MREEARKHKRMFPRFPPWFCKVDEELTLDQLRDENVYYRQYKWVTTRKKGGPTFARLMLLGPVRIWKPGDQVMVA